MPRATAPEPVSLVYRSASPTDAVRRLAVRPPSRPVPDDGRLERGVARQALAEEAGVLWQDWQKLGRDFLNDLAGERAKGCADEPAVAAR